MSFITRKKYFVKQFQVSFFRRFLLLALVAAVLTVVGVYVMTSNTMTTAFENSRLVVKSTQDFMFPVIVNLAIMIVIAMVVLGFAVIFTYSHRIAGPLVRIERFLSQIGQGHLGEKILLRHKDELNELAETCNNMARELQSSMYQIKKTAERLDQVDQDLVDLWRKAEVSRSDLEPVITEFKKVKQELQESLQQFHT